MSNPPERQIEKWLNAARSGRRDQAGLPEMHPATREMLMTEVRRQHAPSSTGARRRIRWWIRMLPRAAVFVAVAGSAWLLWFRDAGEPTTQMAFQPVASPAESPAQSPVLAPRSAPADVQASPGSITGEAGPGLTQVKRESTRPLPAASPAMPAPTASREESRRTPSRSVVGQEYFKSDRQSMYLGTAAVEAEMKQAVDARTDVSLGLLMESPARADRVRVSSTVPEVNPQTAVLQAFTLLNEGTAIRLVDADGSTYKGTIQALPREPADDVDAAARFARSGTAGAPGQRAAGKADQAGSPGELRNYTLLAIGTNRSLGQSIQVTGQLVLSEQQLQMGRNLFSNTIVPEAGRTVEPRAMETLQPNQGRLLGRAILADGVDVKVDAVSATP